MIPLIEREVSFNRKWVCEEEIVDIFAISQSLPGAIAINSSTFIGYKIAGKMGAVVATAGVVMPAFFIISFISMFFFKFQGSPILNSFFSGVRPAIVGLITIAALKVGIVSVVDRTGIALTVLSVIAMMYFHIQAVFAIIGGAAVGLIIYYFFPKSAEKILNRGGNGE